MRRPDDRAVMSPAAPTSLSLLAAPAGCTHGWEEEGWGGRAWGHSVGLHSTHTNLEDKEGQRIREKKRVWPTQLERSGPTRRAVCVCLEARDHRDVQAVTAALAPRPLPHAILPLFEVCLRCIYMCGDVLPSRCVSHLGPVLLCPFLFLRLFSSVSRGAFPIAIFTAGSHTATSLPAPPLQPTLRLSLHLCPVHTISSAFLFIRPLPPSPRVFVCVSGGWGGHVCVCERASECASVLSTSSELARRLGRAVVHRLPLSPPPLPFYAPPALHPTRRGIPFRQRCFCVFFLFLASCGIS